jgi:uncharacterized protein YjbJ (UPF0337 family)
MQNETQSPTRKARDLPGQAKEVARDLKDKTSEVASSAAETLKAQAEEVADQAREIASDAGEKVRAAVANQKSAGAEYLSSIGNSMRRASFEFDGQLPQAGQYIRSAAEQVERLSEAVRNRELSQLVSDVQDFARKQPVAFFGAAALAGFAVVRFLKSAPESRGNVTTFSPGSDAARGM